MSFSLPSFKTYLAFTALLTVNEFLSFFSYTQPEVGWIVFIVLVMATAALSWRKLEIGLLILFAELFVGGKGYLYSLAIGNLRISIRHALFATIILVWLIRFGDKRLNWPVIPRNLRPWLVAFSTMLLVGAVVGVLNNNGLKAVFFDINAFLFYILMVVLLSRALDWKFILPRLFALFAAVATVVGLKSLVTLGLFVHWRLSGLVTFYRWIRETGVGEIAPIFGGTYRVFFQSQIYGVLALAILAPFLVPRTDGGTKRPWWLLVPVVLALSAVLVSLSRSFWMGGVLALIVGVGIGIVQFRWTMHQLLKIAGASIGLFVLAYTLNSWALNFPYPFPPSRDSARANLIRQRLSELGGEAAASSRVEQFKALLPAIARSPVIGSGFGKTVTYVSQDPRQTQSPSRGVFTTYAFELAYLDLALKIGLVGMIAYLGLLGTILRNLWHQRTQLSYGLFLGTVALLGVHLTTPYLNHPLGIGFILIALVIGSTRFSEIS